MEHQPSLYFQNIRIDEPVTVVTDLLVSAVCFYAFVQLSRTSTVGRTHLFFRYYFLLMGVATFLGGIIGHGFLYALSFGWKLPGWIISMISVTLIERSAIEYARPFVKESIVKIFLVVNVLELVLVMSITMYTLNFKWVEFHSGYGLLAIVLPFHAYCFYRTRDQASLIIMLSVAIASLAALVYMLKISFHMWFNYLDISHVVMAIGAYFFYRGAKQLDSSG
jgi:hypothetical protein